MNRIHYFCTMKILLLGEYSNVHWTLSEGLRTLGHDVIVVSDGDRWKNYPRDISIVRKSTSFFDGICYFLQLIYVFSKLRKFDVVQIINPVFIDLKAERILPFYKYLAHNNNKVYMGAFGIDKFWVKGGLDCKTFKYSDFNIGSGIRENSDNTTMINEWLNGPKGILNEQIANACDGIISGLYEYDACYRPYFPEKLRFIPFPINIEKYTSKVRKAENGIVKFFIGIQKKRSVYKGTDIMLKALKKLQTAYPTKCEIKIAESVPFEEYVQMLDDSHVILDQLYSYTPAMNALQAMAQGLVVVGGGEEENYKILNENELRPIINVEPNEESVYNQLEQLILNPERIEELSLQSIEYIRRHHSHTIVAQKYVDFYSKG